MTTATVVSAVVVGAVAATGIDVNAIAAADDVTVIPTANASVVASTVTADAVPIAVTATAVPKAITANEAIEVTSTVILLLLHPKLDCVCLQGILWIIPDSLVDLAAATLLSKDSFDQLSLLVNGCWFTWRCLLLVVVKS